MHNMRFVLCKLATKYSKNSLDFQSLNVGEWDFEKILFWKIEGKTFAVESAERSIKEGEVLDIKCFFVHSDSS